MLNHCVTIAADEAQNEFESYDMKTDFMIFDIMYHSTIVSMESYKVKGRLMLLNVEMIA